MSRWRRLRRAGAFWCLMPALMITYVNMVRSPEFNPLWQGARWLDGEVTRPDAVFVAQVRQFYRRNFPAGGLFIHYVGLDPVRDGKFIYDQYVQATCYLYPKPVLVAPPGTRLDGATAILAHNQVPDDLWLRAHGVQSVLTFSIEGPIPSQTIRRLEALP